MLLLVCMIASKAHGQKAPVTLAIGDHAPPFVYSKWIQGTPFTLDQKDMVYVVEFWATWCGPCKQVMPHLSELSKKYGDEVKFIGVNIWERTGGEVYESVIPRVSQFVEDNKEQMIYNVVVDNNDQYMGTNWMRAAGQRGIPATFIIQNNKIVWIGHPMRLDAVLPKIIQGVFDIEKSKAEILQQKQSAQDNRDALIVFRKQINAAVESKDFEKAFQVIEEGIAQSPRLAFTGRMEKVNILLQYFSEKEAINYVKAVTKQQKSFGTSVAMTLSMRNELSPNIYLFAVALVDSILESNATSILYNLKADLLFKANRKVEAAEALKYAITATERELTDPAFSRSVSPKTLQHYKDKLHTMTNN